uniref:Virion host shutoff protein n=1 Tax=Anatid alphaherpesvirus 2 TaxID=3080522 RepID=A0AAU0K891_9ALPH
MGVYGCMKFAHTKGLVKSQAISLPPGTMIPVAVDLWNVMYGLMEKFHPRKADGDDDAALTLRCLYSLLRLLHRRAYFPIFVSDRGIYGDGKAMHGAKAIVANTAMVGGGSGRLNAHTFEAVDAGDGQFPDEIASHASSGTHANYDDDHDGAYAFDKSRRRQSGGTRQCRWSTKPETPRVLHRLCLSIIRFLGYPYVNATTMEADDLCANLFHTKTVPYVVSSDTDLLLMGCDIIIDVTHLFPLIIRCRDLLAELNVDYATFLLRFVRCHTDLHKEPILKSMQEVVESLYDDTRALGAAGSLVAADGRAEEASDDDEEAAASSDDDDDAVEEAASERVASDEGGIDEDDDDDNVGFSVVRNRRRRANRTSHAVRWRCDGVEGGYDAGDGGVFNNKLPHGRRLSGRIVDDARSSEPVGSVWRPDDAATKRRAATSRRVSRQADDDDGGPRADPAGPDGTATNPTMDAKRALAALGPPRTRCEVLELKFIRHVVSILTPERRTSRVSILKRIPIIQDCRDGMAVRELINRSLEDPAEAESISSMLIKRVPPAPPYNHVLIKYWD